MLGLLAVQVATGLIADDEIATTGPLNKFVSSATGLALTSWHKNWGRWLIVALVTLHVLAVLFYLIGRKRNLIRPMLNGDKALPPGVPSATDSLATRGLALLLVALCGLGVGWLVKLGA